MFLGTYDMENDFSGDGGLPVWRPVDRLCGQDCNVTSLESEKRRIEGEGKIQSLGIGGIFLLL